MTLDDVKKQSVKVKGTPVFLFRGFYLLAEDCVIINWRHGSDLMIHWNTKESRTFTRQLITAYDLKDPEQISKVMPLLVEQAKYAGRRALSKDLKELLYLE